MRRHPTDAVSLLFGALFTVLGVAFLFRDVPWIPELDLRWVAPIAVLLVGLWLLATALRTGASRDRAAED